METGPENKISQVNVSGYAGNICPCCISRDKNGKRLHFSCYKRNGGQKGKTLRNHRR